jgi:hypothetical protein
MNKTSNVVVNILTEFKGLSNVKKAENAFGGLADSIKRLASAYAIEQVVTRSIDAFKAESAAVALLTNSLANLGIQYNDIQPVVEKNVNSMTNLGFKSADTIDALAKLTTALGNPAKALDVLATTADLARYKNMSLAETGVLVAKAIAGNSRAFADLGLKIDKTLTPQNAFNKLLDQAKAKAGGAAEAYANTLGGSLDVAAAKADKASVSLGQALAPAIKQLADFAVTFLVPILNVIANNITPILTMVGAIAALTLGIKALGIASAVAAGEMALNPLFAAAAGVGLVAGLLLKKSAPSTGSPLRAAAGRGGVVGAYQGVTAITKQTEATKKLSDAETILAKFEKQWNTDSLKAANQQKIADAAKIKAEKDKIALEKAKQVLQQSGKVLDVQQAEIVAALMNTADPAIITRLQLQQALLNDNADAAGMLAQKVLEAQKQSLLLSSTDPFANWQTKTAIDEINNLIIALQNLGIAKSNAITGVTPEMIANGTGYVSSQGLSSNSLASGSFSQYYQGLSGGLYGSTPAINLDLTLHSDIPMVANSLANQSAAGTPSTLNRLNFNFG